MSNTDRSAQRCFKSNTPSDSAQLCPRPRPALSLTPPNSVPGPTQLWLWLRPALTPLSSVSGPTQLWLRPALSQAPPSSNSAHLCLRPRPALTLPSSVSGPTQLWLRPALSQAPPSSDSTPCPAQLCLWLLSALSQAPPSSDSAQLCLRPRPALTLLYSAPCPAQLCLWLLPALSQAPPSSVSGPAQLCLRPHPALTPPSSVSGPAQLCLRPHPALTPPSSDSALLCSRPRPALSLTPPSSDSDSAPVSVLAGADGHVPSGRGGHQCVSSGRGAVCSRGADVLWPGEDLHGGGASVSARPEPHHQGFPWALRLQHHAVLPTRESRSSSLLLCSRTVTITAISQYHAIDKHLNIWTLSNNDCGQLRDSYTTITEGSNAHWCSRRRNHALRAGAWKLLNRMEISTVFLFCLNIIFFHLVLPFRDYRRYLHVSHKTK